MPFALQIFAGLLGTLLLAGVLLFALWKLGVLGGGSDSLAPGSNKKNSTALLVVGGAYTWQ
ncbi:MAG: hypothetical protein ACRD36_14195 [Candidatus Acidiferrum sp.]